MTDWCWSNKIAHGNDYVNDMTMQQIGGICSFYILIPKQFAKTQLLNRTQNQLIQIKSWPHINHDT